MSSTTPSTSPISADANAGEEWKNAPEDTPVDTSLTNEDQATLDLVFSDTENLGLDPYRVRKGDEIGGDPKFYGTQPDANVPSAL